MTRFTLLIGLLSLALLTACGAHAPDGHGGDHHGGDHHAADKKAGHHGAEHPHGEHAKGDHPSADKPADAPTTAEADILPNDGTRKVGDITRCARNGSVMTITADTATAEYNGGTYYFCCDGCAKKFLADPEKYLAAAHKPGSQPTTAAADVLPNDGTRQVGDVTNCPVSGDTFTVEADSPKLVKNGKTIWFCCPGCVDKYDASAL